MVTLCLLFLSAHKTNTFSLLLTPHMQQPHEQYMHRCLQLARLGQGKVAPNPMVGAVLVHEGRIIGEGWHQQWGGPHAEVVCVASVRDEDKPLLQSSTMYVSLEPCAHWGKTPPCADLIVEHQIPHVVVSCRDPFPLVAGKGIEKLTAAGVQVTVGVLEKKCTALNKRFFLFHTAHRPYITLKWAQTGDGKIALHNSERLLISSPRTNRLVHRWRSEEAAILVGTNTALKDNPELTVRLWPGSNPIRLVVDLHRRLQPYLHLFDGSVPTVVFNLREHSLAAGASWRQLAPGVHYYQVGEDASLVHQMANALYQAGVQSLFVEGGARTLQAFIDEDLWDEARIITNEGLIVGEGLPAPVLQHHYLTKTEQCDTDFMRFYSHQQNPFAP